jgi:hypothetical protein
MAVMTTFAVLFALGWAAWSSWTHSDQYQVNAVLRDAPVDAAISWQGSHYRSIVKWEEALVKSENREAAAEVAKLMLDPVRVSGFKREQRVNAAEGAASILAILAEGGYAQEAKSAIGSVAGTNSWSKAELASFSSSIQLMDLSDEVPINKRQSLLVSIESSSVRDIARYRMARNAVKRGEFDTAEVLIRDIIDLERRDEVLSSLVTRLARSRRLEAAFRTLALISASERQQAYSSIGVESSRNRELSLFLLNRGLPGVSKSAQIEAIWVLADALAIEGSYENSKIVLSEAELRAREIKIAG